MLAAKPVRHPGARETPSRGDATRVEIPMARRRLARWLTRSAEPVLRAYELDALGSELWSLLDGKRTVRDLIETFSERHRLNLREAEVSVLTYLQTLASRGMIVLQVAPPGDLSSEPE